MKFKIFTALLLATTFTFTSCNNDDEFDPDIILGAWQYSNIERYMIETSEDSLSAAIRYAEIAAREDSMIMKFENGILAIYDKDISNIPTYEYSYDGKSKLIIHVPEEEAQVHQFEVIGNIAIYLTESNIKYQNEDGEFDQKIFNELVAAYPQTMEGLKIEDLEVYKIRFYEIFKRPEIYY